MNTLGKAKATQFSNRLFTRLYFVLIFTIIIIGSGLEYILNTIDESDSLTYTKRLNKPVFRSVNQELLALRQDQWKETINQIADNLDQPMILMRLTDFSADENTLKLLSDGEVLALFDVEDKLTLYQRVEDSDFILAIESTLPEQKDQRIWVLPVFYLLFALVLYVLIRPFAKQLLQLKQAAIDLGLGDFSARVEVPASTTLAPIADAFNAMTKKIERLLLTQRDLVNAVSHELRTPLARLKFRFEEMVLLADEQILNQTVSAMKADVTELEQLIDEMLRYAEVNQIKAFSKSLVKIKTLIESLVNYHNCSTVELMMVMDSTIGEDDMILCHQVSLNRALSNVLRNAISFASKKCEIKIQRQGNNLLIQINDDGVGLSGVNHKRIFEPFFKVVNKKRQPGYGLGLSIAQTIAQKHHGTLQVIEGDLPGACFQFIIPFN